MHLYQMKVSDMQFTDYTIRLWKGLNQVKTIKELVPYKYSIRHVWAQATTDERLHKAEKVSAEYRFLYWKFTKQLEEQS